MEFVAVRGDTCTPISLTVLVAGREIVVSSITSASFTIDGITVALTVDEVENRLTGTIPATLTTAAGVFTGTGSLVTNTGTYTFPDGRLALEVLEAWEPPVLFLATESFDFLMTESDDFLMVET